MTPRYSSGTGSTAAIRGHPLHPVFVPIPIGLLVAAFATDVAFVTTDDAFWARASYWLLMGGLLTGVIAAFVGAIDLISLQRARTMGIAWAHAIGNVVVLAVTFLNYYTRIGHADTPPVPQGVILSGFVLATLVITAWLGGEIVFRHGIAVSREIGIGHETDSPELTARGRPDIGKS